MSKLPLWSLFMRTVEGRPSAASVVMRGGRPGFVSEPIPKGAKPDARPLVDLLRSREPIPPEVRAWLADLLDDEGTGALRLKFSRRGRGAPAGDGTENWPAAQFVEKLIDGGELRKNAITDAAARFSISRSAVEAAIASLKAAREIHDAETIGDLIANDR